MKKLLCICMIFCLIGGAMAVPFAVSADYALPDTVSVSARSAILVSLGATADKDITLFEREADVKRSPAAMIRMMVGTYAVKLIRDRGLDADAVTGTYTLACNNVITGTGLSTANMKIGDTWTLKDLLTVSMLDTAADACVTLAVTLSGSVTAFVDGMNELAVEIGCMDTSFANVTGLDAAGQYTTARDAARFTRYAMEFPEMEAMLSQRQYTVHPIKGTEQTRVNVNAMLRPTVPGSYYEPLSFGRTGYTDNAGRCMTSVARGSGYEYLAVVLGSDGGENPSTAHFRDTKALYEWAFSSFTYKTLLNKNQPVAQLPVELAWSTDKVPLVAKEDFATIVDKNLDASAVRIVPVLSQTDAVEAPVEKGAVYGRAELYINIDQKIGEVDLVAGESLERSEVLAVWRTVRGVLGSPWLYAAIGLLVVLIITYAVISILHNRRRRRVPSGRDSNNRTNLK